MRNRCILFLTDNEALFYVINKPSCKDKHLMFFVRKLVLVCLENNILFKAKHVRGVYNTLADSLSRLQVDTFRHLAPVHMEREPIDIPVHLQPQNWHLYFKTSAVQLATFLPSNVSTGMEALFPIFTLILPCPFHPLFWHFL